MKKFKGISGRSSGIVLPIFLVSALIIAGFPGQISFPNTSGERATKMKIIQGTQDMNLGIIILEER
jgi:hypothetical protein